MSIAAPFAAGTPTASKDHPDRGADGAIPPEGGGEENIYNLPDGSPIARALRRWFNEQKRAVLGTLAHVGAPLPDAIPPLTDWTDPMARAMTPLLSAYWQEAGEETRARLGLDPDTWTVVNPHTKEKIERAAFNFCESTNASTSKRLDEALADLRRAFVAGVVESGDTLPRLTDRVKAIFGGLTESHAGMIAATEASRAVHAAQEQAAAESGVVQGFELLLSSDACPLCRMVATECKRVRVGQAFAVIGHNPDYSTIRHPPIHPRCQCALVEILSPAHGGPAAPDWGATLHQPDPDSWTPPPGKKPPGPEPGRQNEPIGGG